MRALIAVASACILSFSVFLVWGNAAGEERAKGGGLEFEVMVVREHGVRSIISAPVLSGGMLCYNVIDYSSSDFPVRMDQDLILMDAETFEEIHLDLEGNYWYSHTDGSFLVARGYEGMDLVDIRTGERRSLGLDLDEAILSEGGLFTIKYGQKGSEMMSYDIGKEEWTTITDIPFRAHYLVVRGPHMAYFKYFEAGAVVCLRDIMGGEEVVLSALISNLRYLSMDRRHLIWAQEDGILLHDIERSMTTTIAPGMKVRGLSIDGDIAVWSGCLDPRGDRYNLFVHHISSGRTVEVFMNASSQSYPCISGRRIAYIDRDQRRDRMMMLEITSLQNAGRKPYDMPLNATNAYQALIAADLMLVLIIAATVFFPEEERSAPLPEARERSLRGRDGGLVRRPRP